MTEHGEKLCIADLRKLIDEGYAQIDIINQTIMSGKWKGFWPVKKNINKDSKSTSYNYSQCSHCKANASSIRKGKECPFCGEIV